MEFYVIKIITYRFGNHNNDILLSYQVFSYQSSIALYTWKYLLCIKKKGNCAFKILMNITKTLNIESKCYCYLINKWKNPIDEGYVKLNIFDK